MAKSRKVLLIDYDPESIESIRGPLVRAGYEVEIASDGIAGIEAFGRLKPDLVLIEPMVPKKHGFQVCQEIKSTPEGRDTPVLITTGFYRGRKHRDEAHESYGCDDYLEKPIAEELLLSTCGKFLIDTQEPPIPVADEARASVSLAIPASELSGAPQRDGLVDSLPDLPIAGEKKSSELQALDDLTEDEIQERLDAMIIGLETPQAEVPPVVEEPQPVIAEAPKTPVERPPKEIVPASVVSSAPDPEPISAAPAVEPEVAFHSSVESSQRSRWPLWIGIAASLFIVMGIGILWILRDQGDADPSIETASISIGQTAPAPSAVLPNPSPLRLPSVPVPDVDEAGLTDEAAPGGESGAVVASDDAPTAEPIEAPAATSALIRDAANVPQPRTTVPPTVTPQPPASTTGQVAEVKREEKIDTPPEPKPAVVDDSTIAAETSAEGEAQVQAMSEPVVDPPIVPILIPEEEVAPRTRRGDLVDLAELDRAPVATNKPMPEYPPSALSMRIEGTVHLRLLVDERGRVEQVEVVSGTKRKQLQRAATRAAENWVYEPGVKDDVAVKVWVPATVKFKL
jgi:TonB family protein